MNTDGNGAFGLEHPLVTTRHLEGLAASYEALGFDPTATTWHPWGTHNRLIMLHGNFIELIGIGDMAQVERDPCGGQNFGAHLAHFLKSGEGVSLLALHSKDIDADVARIRARGREPDARISFQREVTLPDGRNGEAVVSLATYIDERGPAVSHFLCQQHRPEMIFDPRWRRHRNSARRIQWCLYLAPSPDDLREHFLKIFGPDKLIAMAGGFRIQTAGGALFVLPREQAASLLPELDLPDPHRCSNPHITAIGIDVDALDLAAPFALREGGKIVKRTAFIPQAAAGNVALALFEAKDDPLRNAFEGL